MKLLSYYESSGILSILGIIKDTVTVTVITQLYIWRVSNVSTASTVRLYGLQQTHWVDYPNSQSTARINTA